MEIEIKMDLRFEFDDKRNTVTAIHGDVSLGDTPCWSCKLPPGLVNDYNNNYGESNPDDPLYKEIESQFTQVVSEALSHFMREHF